MIFSKNIRLLKKKMLFVFLPLVVVIAVIIMFTGCYSNSDIENKIQPASDSSIASETLSPSEKTSENSDTEINIGAQESTESVSPIFTDVKEGLHVTGKPIEIDIEEYRLSITGLVKNELRFSFDEVKDLPSVRIYAVLDCPGFFVDKGYWTGVKIIDLLNLAGLDEDATRLRFVDADDSYDKSILIEKIRENENGFLVAYEFNDEGFSEVHGFPLRIVAEGEPGSVWVKWLGKIEVLE